MAERRMFAKSVVLEDRFMELAPMARCLYYTLNMEADDDGFVGAPKGIVKFCGAKLADLQRLVQAGYLRSYDDGVVRINHWLVNNQIRKDRYRPSVYAGPDRD